MEPLKNSRKITSTPKPCHDKSNISEKSSLSKPIFRMSPVKLSPDQSLLQVKWRPFESSSFAQDSGFGSLSADSSRTSPLSTWQSSSLATSCSPEQTSLFNSICQASNLSPEQVVERVQERRKGDLRSSSSYQNRTLSISDSEVSGQEPCGRDNLSAGNDSPTLDQAILMGSRGRSRGRSDSDRIFMDSGFYDMSPDYDLAELVQALNLKSGPLAPPSTPSPPSPTYVKSPSSLFGPEFLSANFLGSNSRRRPLPTISETCPPPPSASFPLLSPVYPEGPMYPAFSPSPTLLDQAALLDESLSSQQDSSCTWSGQLPPNRHKNPVYSCKIFVGGVPWDVTEFSLIQAFKQFGNIRIEWPGKDSSPSPPKGYVYIIFEQEQNVPLLLAQCTHDFANGGSWYYKISSRRMRSKEVQIIPWVLADSNFVKCPSQRLDSHKTVFVGALHGMLNAEGLGHIFSDLFGGVVYAGIDTDKHKYPIGSGRVTFNNTKSYMKAVAAAFIEVKCQKFSKKVQVDPYLEDALCSLCLLKQGPYFCRDLACFTYFCRYCWDHHHSQGFAHHRPLMRNNRAGGGPATRPTIFLSPVSGGDLNFSRDSSFV
jgi:cytoplasmic polyadenylation element-binding protein